MRPGLEGRWKRHLHLQVSVGWLWNPSKTLEFVEFRIVLPIVFPPCLQKVESSPQPQREDIPTLAKPWDSPEFVPLEKDWRELFKMLRIVVYR